MTSKFKNVIDPNPDMGGNTTEVTCGVCDEYFKTNTILTECPACGDVVISCDACDNSRCRTCIDGSAFRLYGSDIAVEEKKKSWWGE